jgi:hypothetical protein
MLIIFRRFFAFIGSKQGIEAETGGARLPEKAPAASYNHRAILSENIKNRYYF